MIYKNGIKEYTLTTVLFGVPMGFIFGVLRLSLLLGIIMGVFSGLLFSLLMFAFIKFQEKQFDKKRIEIAKERKLICDGGATIQENGGWLFLTENGLEFYPHKINVSTEEIKIPMNMIESVNTYRNQIVVHTVNKSAVVIVVSHNGAWKKQIEDAVDNAH